MKSGFPQRDADLPTILLYHYQHEAEVVSPHAGQCRAHLLLYRLSSQTT